MADEPHDHSPALRPATPEDRIPLNRSNSSLTGLVSKGIDRVGEELGDGLVLLDVIETYFDSRLDLWERRLKEKSAKLRRRAGELIPKGLRTPGGGGILILDDDAHGSPTTGAEGREGETRRRGKYRVDTERELIRMKLKVADKAAKLASYWHSAKTVRLREKLSFLFGVSSLAFTAFVYGRCPDWIPFAYTVQAFFYLVSRSFLYKHKNYHYFLFDMCYFVNILDLIWLWLYPQSTVLFIGCYLLSMGPLASAIITWRNSMVFHSLDKVTSLFIHIYPPIVFNVVLFDYPNNLERYPGLAHINDYKWYIKIVIAAVPYILWQAAYFKFISIDRKEKIESGQRANSFHYLLNDKRGPIGRALRGIPPEHRELWFIFGQLIYSIIFMIPPATLLIHNKRASSIFIIVIFLASVWNGATFYVEVFGRKFERELEQLRKEMEQMSQTLSGNPTPSNPGTPFTEATSPLSTPGVDAELAASPLVLPKATTSGEIPAMSLSAAIESAHAAAGDAKEKKE